jgi:hypothetical protein
MSPVDPHDSLDARAAEKVGPAPRSRAAAPLWVQVLRPVASLRLTVVLFSLSLGLVFFGTLAQMEQGIWATVRNYFWSPYVMVPFQLLVKFGQIFFWLPTHWAVRGAFPFPGGMTLGLLLFVNLIAAHLTRFRLTWKRSGILVLHFGVLMLMVGEFITREYAVEGRMRIFEGESSNYVSDYHRTELVVIDPSDARTESVVAVPQGLLTPGKPITDDALPFDIEVRDYMPNSDLARIHQPDPANAATAGRGLKYVAVRLPEVKGTDGEKTDLPSAYVTLRGKNGGPPINTYLLSTYFDEIPGPATQDVAVGGKTYQIALRFQRTYKPYTVSLLDLRHDVYPGTAIPKNFESDVRLVDPQAGVDRDAMIYMNHPLRHAGETFYQQQMAAAVGSTTLQVVRNPGWVLPYVSCTLVALGMLVHFGLNLISFLRRRAA